MVTLPSPSRENLRGLVRSFFRPDYAFPLRFAPSVYLLGLPAEPFYSWYESAHGYRDPKILRIACMAAYLAIALTRRFRSAKWYPILWEAVLFFGLNFCNLWRLLANGGDAYYASSLNVIWFLLGALSRPLALPFHLGAGFAITYAYCWGHPESGTAFGACMGAQVNALLCGLGSAIIMQFMEVYHRKASQAGIALAKAEAESRRAADLEAANAALRRREECIARFVRPSVLEEIRAGKDPADFVPVTRELAVLFCDIRDFTHMTEVLTAREKQEYLNRYFSLMTRPIAAQGGEVDKIIGDAVMALFPDGQAASRAAVAMRLALQGFNRDLLVAGKDKIRNGIGITKGEVLVGNFGSHEKLDRTVVGEAANIASRLEAKTKLYNLEIVVTGAVMADLGGFPHARWIDIVQVKGSSRHLRIYELYAHQPRDVVAYKDMTKPLLEKALEIYFHKGFRDALRMFEALRAKAPPHKHLPREIMDHLLDYYIDRCRAWIGDPGGWAAAQAWDGVHAFTDK